MCLPLSRRRRVALKKYDFALKRTLYLVVLAFVAFATKAQGPEEDFLSGLARVVTSSESVETAATVNAQNEVDIFSGILDGLSSESEEVSIADLVGIVAGVNNVENVGFVGQMPSGALNFVANAYSTNGFYNSGYWGNNGNNGARGMVNIPYMGALAYPGWSQITSGFGYRPSFGRMHKGLDIAMEVGDTVRSALPGVVKSVNYEARGYGHYVVISHDNGVETRYAHLSRPLVSAGQRVSAGESIALSGNSGNSTGPHLHFETRVEGIAVDPRNVFDFNDGKKLRGSSYANGMRNVGQGDDNISGSVRNRGTYVVRQGDTVKKVAAKAGISVVRLCQLNLIGENEALQPGRMLKLR